jgi:hypothetical protein
MAHTGLLRRGRRPSTFSIRYPDRKTTGVYHDDHPDTAADAGLRGLLLSRHNRVRWPTFIPAFTGGISLANATGAGIVSFWVLHDAAGAGWGVIVPSAVLATLGLTIGGLWWITRRRPSRWTGIGIGLLVGVFVHPLTWYLALLLAFFHGDRVNLGDPTLTPWESLAGVWVYSFFSLLLTGWLSCPISAAICWTGLALYLRRLESPLPQTAILCSSCGADWSRGTFSQHCRECGGGALEHACRVRRTMRAAMAARGDRLQGRTRGALDWGVRPFGAPRQLADLRCQRGPPGLLRRRAARCSTGGQALCL